MNKGKDKYRKYVFKFFNANELSKCATYLQAFFCEPVEKLIQTVAPTLEKSTNKANLLRLLKLYTDYHSLNSIDHLKRDFDDTTRSMVRLMRKCYVNYTQWSSEDQKWLCSLIDNCGNNYFTTENLHTYRIQCHHLFYGFKYYPRKKFFSSDDDNPTEEPGLLQIALGGNWSFENVFPKEICRKFFSYAKKRWEQDLHYHTPPSYLLNETYWGHKWGW